MFISLEGIEGCGKSTQAKRLVKHLQDLDIPVIATLEPGGTRIGGYIRNILLDSRNQDLSPLAELLLYAADRAQHVGEVIQPSLSEGKWVVCDRFFDATTSYQGYARGLDQSLIAYLRKTATLGIQPDITFLIDCPVEIGVKRALNRNKMLEQETFARFEKERLEFHEAVRAGYLSIAREESERVVVVDGTMDEDGLEKAIFDHVRPFIG